MSRIIEPYLPYTPRSTAPELLGSGTSLQNAPGCSSYACGSIEPEGVAFYSKDARLRKLVPFGIQRSERIAMLDLAVEVGKRLPPAYTGAPPLGFEKRGYPALLASKPGPNKKNLGRHAPR